MKKLSIYELLKGYKAVSFPDIPIKNTPARPTLLSNDIKEDSLLFVYDSLGTGRSAFDASSLSISPLAIVTSKEKEIVSAPCPIIRADDPREAFAYATSNYCGIDYGKIKFIGVTGTNGKTTTATLIYEILRKCGYRAGLIGTGKIISDGKLLSDDVYSMTTPDPTILYPTVKAMSDDGCDYVVMEVSSHSIALGKIAPIKFEYAIFTNLDNDHLDFHRCKEDYFQAKLKLFSQAETGLFNLDDEYSKKASELARCKKRTFGVITPGDAFATEIELSSLYKTSFYYRQKHLIFKVHTNLCGAFNVYNSLAALTCVMDLGIRPCIAKRAISSINGVCGRMEIIDGEIRAVIDYAHTPMAFYNSLKTLKSNLKAKQKLIVVFGCGGNRDRSKRKIFGEYADMLADTIIITEDNSRSEGFANIANDILSGIRAKEPKIIPDREKAIKYAFKHAERGDVVAMIGKGHEKYKIVKNEYLPFDEREIIRDAMKERGALNASEA